MYLVCPNCGVESEHEILSFKDTKGGKEYVLRCKNCGYTYSRTVKDSKMIDLKVIFSEQGKSYIKKYSTFEDDILSVGEEIRVEGINSLVTAIDSSGRRVQKAAATDIDTLWVKRFDTVIVKISINRGERTLSGEVVAAPDEEFYIGDIVEVNGIHGVVHKIKTMERFVHRGGALAREIVRVYAKEIREGRRKY